MKHLLKIYWNYGPFDGASLEATTIELPSAEQRDRLMHAINSTNSNSNLLAEVPAPELNGVVFTPWLCAFIQDGSQGHALSAIKAIRMLTRSSVVEARDFYHAHVSQNTN